MYCCQLPARMHEDKDIVSLCKTLAYKDDRRIAIFQIWFLLTTARLTNTEANNRCNTQKYLGTITLDNAILNDILIT